MIVIGLHGKKRRGKDTVAQIIAELLGVDNCVMVSPADRLKLLLCSALGMPQDDIPAALALMEECKDAWRFEITKIGSWESGSDNSKLRLNSGWATREPVKSFTGRQFQEWAGTGARDVLGTDIWIDLVAPPTTHYLGEDHDRLQSLYPGKDVLLIPSARFLNEAQRCHDYGGFVIEVVRPQLDELDPQYLPPSERRLPDHEIDYTINNDSTLDDLRTRTEAALVDLGVLR